MHPAERVARESYGKLLAYLAAASRDVAAAEDALADAFAAALATWPTRGLPDNPEAWLHAAAKRRLIDAARRRATAKDAEPQLVAAHVELEETMRDSAVIPDRRLGLMFACAHPALDEGIRTALMLQTVLGLNAERIAAAFMVEPQAMGQRLVRAKRKIREAGAPFAIPAPEVWPERLAAVLDAIYAAFSEGWRDADGADPETRALAGEAIWLCRVLLANCEDAEVFGLLALMLHLEARRPARRGSDGAFMPLRLQDTALWDAKLIDDAERLLFRAAAFKRPGRYQLEAAIQSAHAMRRRNGATDWGAIIALYDALAALTGSPVALLNRAAALGEAGDVGAALEACEALSGALAGYQPWWALYAHLLGRTGNVVEARAAYGEAIARERDPAVIRFLADCAARLPPTGADA